MPLRPADCPTSLGSCAAGLYFLPCNRPQPRLKLQSRSRVSILLAPPPEQLQLERTTCFYCKEDEDRTEVVGRLRLAHRHHHRRPTPKGGLLLPTPVQRGGFE